MGRAMGKERQFFSNYQKSGLFRSIVTFFILACVVSCFYSKKEDIKNSHMFTSAKTPPSSDKINQKPSITVIYPNGGERWVLGKSYKVRWKSSGIDKVNVLLIDYRAPESCYLNYTPVDAEKGEFVIENLSTVRCKTGMGWAKQKISPGDKYVIQVEKAGNDRSIYDSSDGYFSIVSATTWKTYREKPLAMESIKTHTVDENKMWRKLESVFLPSDF